MRVCTRQTLLVGIAISIFARHTPAQQTPCEAKQTNSSKVGPEGTVFVTRIMPVPVPSARKHSTWALSSFIAESCNTWFATGKWAAYPRLLRRPAFAALRRSFLPKFLGPACDDV
jgi:hypothetical protein